MERLDYEINEVRIEDERVSVSLMRNVYIWMTLALAITGAMAYLTTRSSFLSAILEGSPVIWIVSMVAEVLLVGVLSAVIERLSFVVATILFVLYSVLNGFTLSTIFMAYELSSITSAFLIAAGMFAVMAFIGIFTKKDFSGLGKFALMALIGFLLAAVVNLFLKSPWLDYLISAAGVLLFAGLTAYDSQRIKEGLQNSDAGEESTMKYALTGALTLYLDFINLFLNLLRIFGKRR